MTEISKYLDNLEFLPEKERDAVKELAIHEKEIENASRDILRGLRISQGNDIKGFGGRI